MLMTLHGCGYNGFSQLDDLKCLKFNDLGLIVCSRDCSASRTDQRNKIVLPELLVQLHRDYDLDKILFTWSRIAVTLKTGCSGYTSVITGFTSTKVQERDDSCGAALAMDEHIVTASTDTDILLKELKDVVQNKLIHENGECELINISLPNKTTALQIVHGGHQDFFVVYDFMTFGKLITTADTLADKNTDAGKDRDMEVMLLHLYPIDSGIQIQEISCGKEHTLILSQFGTVYSYGLGSRGQLGHSTVEAELSPRLLAALEGVRMRSVCAGGWHSASVSDFGDVYVWGWNESGQLGMPTLSKDASGCQSDAGEECVGIQTEPSCITLPDELNISAVACGSRHTVLLTDAGRVFTAGWNAYGQLGLGDTTNKDRFTEVVMPKGLCIKIFVGQWNSMFVCNSNKQHA